MTLPSTYTKITFPSTNDAVIVPTESNNLNITNEDVPPINTKFVNMGVVNPFDNKLIQTILTVSQNVALRVSTTQLNIHKTTGDGFNLFVGDKVILLTKDDAKYELTITENFTNASTALKFNAVIFDTPIGDGAIITISQSDQFNEGNRKTRGQVAGFTISPSTITKNGIGISSWFNDPTFTAATHTTLPTSQAVKEYVLSKKNIIEDKLIKVNNDVINKSAFLHDDGLRFTRVSDGAETGQINYDGVDTITLNSNGGSSTGATRLDFQVNSGSKMVIDNEGKVGIGTASPTSLLTVGGSGGSGSFKVQANTNSSWFSVASGNVLFNDQGGITKAGGIDLGARFNIAPVNDTKPSLAVRGFSGGVSDIMRISSPSVTTGDYMIVKSTGKVGIGTTSPGSKLQVYTGNAANANDGITLMRGAGFDVFGIKHRSDAGGIYRGAITYDAAEVMTFLINGKVGIGTTSPQNKLDIVGSLGRGIPVTKTANFTVAATENWLIVNGLATITITLPTASSFTGRELMIKNIAAFTVVSASSNVKPIDTNTAATAILPAIAGSWCALVSDGSDWVTMMNG
jgi:hypothetical protein